MKTRFPSRLLLLCAVALGAVWSDPFEAAAAEGETDVPAAARETPAPQSAFRPRESERHFERLTIGPVTYTNVLVHRQTNFNVLIHHAGGIDTIRLTNLLKSELEELRPQLGDLANIREEKEPEIVTRFKDMKESELSAEYRARFEEQWQELQALAMTLLLPLAGVVLLLHFISSFFIYMLCKKTNTKAGLTVWLPVLNQTALLRAAGLPGVWALLGFMAPLIPPAVFTAQLVQPASLSGMLVAGISLLLSLACAVVWVVWCFKICLARQKSGWLGILLLIPGVNLVTITYLAFAE